MTQEEIESTYRELSEILASNRLQWVMDQVTETIASGHAVEKPTRIIKEDEAELPAFLFEGDATAFRRTGKPTSLLALEPWSAADRLLFLIDGLRQAIVRAAEIENETLRLFRKGARVEEIRFEHDEENPRP